MMETLVMDLETIPVQDAAMRESLRADADAALADEVAAIKAPQNYKDPQKIADFIADAQSKMLQEHDAAVEAAWLKTGLDGGLGQICVIGYALGEQDPQAITARHDVLGDEAAALREFFGVLQAMGSGARLTWVGHNLIGFDLPFIWKRAIVLGIRPPFHLPRDPKPWDERVFDTMLQWAGARGTISMDRLCRILGIPGKGEISGKDVWPLVQAGRLAEVATYCKGDIERTRAMHQRMTFDGVSFAKHTLKAAA